MSLSSPPVTARHLGGDRLEIRVRDHVILADQPSEDGGEDTAPTPTELFVASLAGCVTFYAERFLRRRGASTDGLTVTCSWQWKMEPARVGEIAVAVTAPSLTADMYDAFARVVEHCPIHHTLQLPAAVSFSIDAPRARKAS